jgi:hypothetical protein
MSDIFISYSRKDQDFVRRLHDALAQAGRDVWVDWEDIPKTIEWKTRVYAGIEGAKNFVFVLSPDSIASPICGEELAHALEHNKRLIPIVYRNVDPQATPPALAQLNWIFFRDADNFDDALAALLKAMDTDVAWVDEHTRLLTRAIEWDKQSKDNSFLLRGKDLREAEEWLAHAAAKEPSPTLLQSQYIAASRQAVNRQQRFLLAGISVALVIAIILAAIAFIQRNVAIARGLAAAAVNNLELDPELSISQALDAVSQPLIFDRSVQLEAEDALQRAVQSSRALRVLKHDNQVLAVAFNRDGTRLATASFDKGSFTRGTVRVWDSATGKLLLTIPLPGVNDVAYNSDDTRLAAALTNGTVVILDVNSGQTLRTLDHSGNVVNVTFNSNGSEVASSSEDGSVRVWKADSGEPLYTFSHKARVSGVAFSPDDKMLATASWDRTAVVWDLASGTALHTFKHDDVLNQVAFSPDGTRLAVANILSSGLNATPETRAL